MAGVATVGQAQHANVILTANDESVVYRDNELVFLENPGVGTLALLDFETFPPTSRTLRGIPVTVIGPPTSLALVPGTSLAIVTNAMLTRQTDEDMAHKPDTRVALVDLSGPGKLIDISEAGLQPSGVSVTPDGRLALVANRAEGTISTMAIERGSLVEKSRTKVAEGGDALSHVEIGPDGRTAVATLTDAGAILVLRLAEDGVPTVISRLDRNEMPYAARFLPDGSGFFVADIERHVVSHYRLENESAIHVNDFPVGRIPEGLDISPDGEWIAVSCFNGGNLTDTSHPKFGEPSAIYFLHHQNGDYLSAGSVKVKGAPQFAVFSSDGNYLAVSNTGQQELLFLQRSDDLFELTDFRVSVEGEPVAAVGGR